MLHPMDGVLGGCWFIVALIKRIKNKGRGRGMALYFLHEILANLQKQKLLAKHFLYPLLLYKPKKKKG
jgi:hypothetical protein